MTRPGTIVPTETANAKPGRPAGALDARERTHSRPGAKPIPRRNEPDFVAR